MHIPKREGKEEQSLLRKFAPHAGALLTYSALVILATWPLVYHLPTHFAAIPGELGQDVWQHTWNLWWIKHALLTEHTNPYTTQWLFYPQGASLYLHSLNLPLGIIGLPLLPLVGIVTTYNLLTVLVMVLVAYSMFLLSHKITRHFPSALVAGAIVLCSPQRLFELRAAQLATLSDYTVPLALLAMLVTLERHTWKSAMLTATVMLITGLSKWYHLFHVLLALFPLFTWRCMRAWGSGGRATLANELIPWVRTGMLTTLLVMPFLLPALFETVGSSYARKSDELVFSTDSNMILPATIGGIWQTVPPDWWDSRLFAWGPLLLVLVGILGARRHVVLWATTAGFCFLLSFGPSLLIDGQDTGIPMPYMLFRLVPVIDTLRAPVRINAVTTMMLALVAASGVAMLLRHVSPRVGWGLALALCLLIAVETIRLPFPLVPAQVSPFYQQIARESGRWSILELPLNLFDRARMEMYAQTYHEHYILTGLISRSIPRMPQEAVPPFRKIEANDTRPDIVTMRPNQREQLLRAMRVRYLTVRVDPHNPNHATQQIASARYVLGPLTRVYADHTLHAYRLDNVAAWLDGGGRTVQEEYPLLVALGDGWEPLEYGWYDAGRWLSPRDIPTGDVWVYTSRPRRVLLEMTLYSLPGERPLEIWLNGAYQYTLPIAADTKPRRYQGPPLILPAGHVLIELRAPQGGIAPRTFNRGNDRRTLSFSFHHIDIQEMGE